MGVDIMPSVKLSELLDALDIASFSAGFENTAYVSRATGEIICVFEDLDEEEQVLPELYDEVEDVFRRKGAYSRYKALLAGAGKLEAWYEFEEAETESALKEWAEEEGIEVIDDKGR